MWHHVYPHWHKAAQRCFSFIAVVLLITLPVVYGKHHSISSKVLGSVLGVFFAIWIAFSLIVRFLVPSPVVESTLPIYTHSPIPDPVVLYSPTRSDATPAAPAIRLHPSSAATPRAPGRTGGARFADDPVDVDAAAEGTGGAIRNNVTFQTRPRGNTADSTSSFAYPTFAAYRQAQHVNFDAFAQRVKRAFALSQQQQQEQQRELEEQELQKQQQQQDEELDELKQQQQQHPLSLDQQRPTNSRSNSTSAVPSSTLATNAPATGTRSRSSSAASMMSDFAERLKTGKLFRRASNLSLRTTAVANAAASEAAGVSSSTLSKRPSNQQLKDSNNTAGDAELLSSPLAPLGIEITVTPSEDDHPSTGNAHTPTTTTATAKATATATTGSAPAIPASAASSL
ncbi:hypothetical protein KI688_006731 [Linnemannia hyalina]|uniref:Uncharacterized protein n=1 Tax=Linnemannia hyalina TaxID=64524 RepID=A0A9P7XM32_9FUNG|nr:hypothetical protein KI688_006731 [Linnemannia hyalina]